MFTVYNRMEHTETKEFLEHYTGSLVGAQSICPESVCLIKETVPSVKTSTFKKITFVSCPSPDVDESIQAPCWDPVPASEDVDGVAVSGPVVAVFIKPVPAVAEKICAKSHRHISMSVSLCTNPVKCSIK